MSASLSIIIPIYNAASTIERCLNSLNNIDCENRSSVEIVLIDDGSTDVSDQIIRQCMDSLNGFKVVHLQQNNAGVSAARNRGLRASTGEWVLFLDADDELNADCIACLSAEADVSAISFPVVRQWANGTRRTFPASRFETNRFLEVFSARNPIVICSLIFKRKAITVGFDEQLAYLEDWLFWLDNPDVFRNVTSLQQGPVLSVVHIHGQNRTAHYNKSGICRAHIAYRKLQQYKDQLNHKTRCNLLIQAAIGEVQAGKGTSIKNLLRLPCSGRLYLRFIAHLLLRSFANYLAPY